MRLHFFWIILIIFACFGPTASAVDYVNTNNANINDTTACGSNDVVRTFTVNDSFIIGDVNLGFQAEHTYRGDINLRLVSPAGTEVQLIAPDISVGFANYNVLLDDQASTPINTAPHTTPDGTTSPPYENLVQPSSPLAAFNSENTQGTWSLLICDSFTQDGGFFNIATLTLTEEIIPPSVPSLTCSLAEQIAFPWGAPGTTNGWAAATLSNNYIIGSNIPMDITITGDTQYLIPRNGIDTPVTTTEFTGGATSQNSVTLYANFPSQSNSITLTIDLGATGSGVASIAFDIFDIDANTWVDRVTINGALNGTNVPVNLTGSTSNTVSGNQVIGTSSAPSTSAGGNASILFDSAIDQIIITYDNDPSVGANPAAQVMSFFANMRICPTLAADLTAVKSVSVFDPTNEGLYMTPGNEVLYTITINNSAAATAVANDITLSDTLPDNLTFLSATATGFTGGSFGSPALPAANTDCTGGNCIINFAGASLAEDSTGEIVVRALIQ